MRLSHKSSFQGVGTRCGCRQRGLSKAPHSDAYTTVCIDSSRHVAGTYLRWKGMSIDFKDEGLRAATGSIQAHIWWPKARQISGDAHLAYWTTYSLPTGHASLSQQPHVSQNCGRNPGPWRKKKYGAIPEYLKAGASPPGSVVLQLRIWMYFTLAHRSFQVKPVPLAHQVRVSDSEVDLSWLPQAESLTYLHMYPRVGMKGKSDSRTRKLPHVCYTIAQNLPSGKYWSFRINARRRETFNSNVQTTSVLKPPPPLISPHIHNCSVLSPSSILFKIMFRTIGRYMTSICLQFL